jgi:hypothetical protein
MYEWKIIHKWLINESIGFVARYGVIYINVAAQYLYIYLLNKVEWMSNIPISCLVGEMNYSISPIRCLARAMTSSLSPIRCLAREMTASLSPTRCLARKLTSSLSPIRCLAREITSLSHQSGTWQERWHLLTLTNKVPGKRDDVTSVPTL